MPKIFEEVHTSYIHDEDITIVWQSIYCSDDHSTDIISRAIVGWYYGTPNDEVTKEYSNSTLIATYIDLLR